jgi:hypothetical protein
MLVSVFVVSGLALFAASSPDEPHEKRTKAPANKNVKASWPIWVE